MFDAVAEPYNRGTVTDPAVLAFVTALNTRDEQAFDKAVAGDQSDAVNASKVPPA